MVALTVRAAAAGPVPSARSGFGLLTLLGLAVGEAEAMMRLQVCPGRLGRVAGVARVPVRGLASGVGACASAPRAPGKDRGREDRRIAVCGKRLVHGIGCGIRDEGGEVETRAVRVCALRTATDRRDGSGWPAAHADGGARRVGRTCP